MHIFLVAVPLVATLAESHQIIVENVCNVIKITEENVSQSRHPIKMQI